MPYPSSSERDRAWVMRTYAGHSSAGATNALFRRNLAKGQTGLSVAFDLPTQTGYDADHELARSEVKLKALLEIATGRNGGKRRATTPLGDVVGDLKSSSTIKYITGE